MERSTRALCEHYKISLREGHIINELATYGQVLLYTIDGMAYNYGTKAALLTCPLVRDGERRMARITYAAVNVEKPSDSSVSCGLYSAAYFGGAGWSTGASDDSTATGLRLITLPVKADTFVSGSFNIWCTIPPGGGIRHYGIVEAD